MTINTTKAVQIKLTATEFEAILDTMKTLRAIHEEIGEGVELVSTVTGAMIDTDELPRILGVLDELLVNDFHGGFVAIAK